MNKFASRFAYGCTAVLLTAWLGCGGGDEAETSSTPQSSADSVAATSGEQESTPKPVSGATESDLFVDKSSAPNKRGSGASDSDVVPAKPKDATPVKSDTDKPQVTSTDSGASGADLSLPGDEKPKPKSDDPLDSALDAFLARESGEDVDAAIPAVPPSRDPPGDNVVTRTPPRDVPQDSPRVGDLPTGNENGGSSRTGGSTTRPRRPVKTTPKEDNSIDSLDAFLVKESGGKVTVPVRDPEPEQATPADDDADDQVASASGATASDLEPPAEDLLVDNVIEKPRSASEMLSQQLKLDQTIWAPELEAQRHERIFVDLWDQLLTAGDKAAVIMEFPVTKVFMGKPLAPAKMDLGIRSIQFSEPTRELRERDWQRLLTYWSGKGYRVIQSEFRHEAFHPAKGDQPARSSIRVKLHLTNKDPVRSVILRCNLDVEWTDETNSQGRPVPGPIIIRDLQLLDRQEPSPFRRLLAATTNHKHRRLMPLIVTDIDGDGLSEIILGGLNLIYWNHGNGHLEPQQLLTPGFPMFDAAVVADFTGDGRPDLVCVGQDRQLMLFEGNDKLGFNDGYRCATFRFDLPKSFTAGDVDGDGDLDLFVGQYKFPYAAGTMPTPYYDAADGYAAVLLENDGAGHFTDMTRKSGLHGKRGRRTYSSSLIDFDGDGDLDLVVVSDYAGVDLYRNNGKGRFSDVTDTLGEAKYLFGRGHTFGDFNSDGQIDLFVAGTSSSTARRLDLLGLERPDDRDANKLRGIMGSGNRLYLSRGDRLEEAEIRDQVADSGWGWGTTNWDFDNDGDRDIYVANGQSSGRSSLDYDSRFWRHDVYTTGSTPNAAAARVFGASMALLQQNEISWHGYQQNSLFMNDDARGYQDVAFLLGLSYHFDSRGVVSDDIDGDGRPDLLVVEHRLTDNGAEYRMHVLLNQLETGNRWIGVRLGHGKGISPIGAKVTVKHAGGTQVAHIVTGDSFSSQHPASAHFGLGKSNHIQWLEVEWPGGKKTRKNRPNIDKWHVLKPE